MGSLIFTLRGNARTWAILATISWGIMTLLWGCERFFDPRNDFADGGASGIYAVHAVGISESGEPVYVIDHAIAEAQPGDLVGWVSRLCVERGVFLTSRPDIVRARDGFVVKHGRERLWTPQDQRCGSAVAALELPVAIEPGDYEIRRYVWAHPMGYFPQRAELASVRFRVGAGTKATR